MRKVITTERFPIKLWLDDIEDGALDQAKNLANLPFAFKHIAIMPDAHQGYGMPIGGVMATRGVVIPSAVGVDVGCGVCAVKTSLTEIENLKEIMSEIRKVVPVGFNKHKEEQEFSLMPYDDNHDVSLYDDYKIVYKEYNNALMSLGTLGGGNHFIEIQKDSDGHIWVMLHSGSRNLGYTIAQYYNKLAIGLNEQWHSQVPKKWELAFLPLDTNEGRAYMREMNYAVEYAFANRKLMMDRIMNIIESFESVKFASMINIAHNYAAMENHFGQNVMVHRKGATLARKGTMGIIPGSQGTKSYIVEGLGNPDSFQSCSHGAGRVMGRRQAQRELDFESEVKKLEDQGILHSIRGVKDLDEASGAYKPIEEVMANQTDLVEIKVELTPLAVIKG